MGAKQLIEIVPDDCPDDFLCCENEVYELMSTLDTPQAVEIMTSQHTCLTLYQPMTHIHIMVSP